MKLSRGKVNDHNNNSNGNKNEENIDQNIKMKMLFNW